MMGAIIAPLRGPNRFQGESSPSKSVLFGGLSHRGSERLSTKPAACVTGGDVAYVSGGA